MTPFDGSDFGASVALDGTDYPQKPAHPDAAYLSRVLREGPNGAGWPQVNGEPLKWNYNMACQCGMGVAWLLWPTTHHARGYYMGQLLSIGENEGFQIFENLPSNLGFVADGDENSDKAYERVTPQHVADALDAAVAAQVKL